MSEFKLYHYDPSFTAAIIFLALFSALTLCHLFQLIRYRTFYLVPFLIGCICKWLILLAPEYALIKP